MTPPLSRGEEIAMRPVNLGPVVRVQDALAAQVEARGGSTERIDRQRETTRWLISDLGGEMLLMEALRWRGWTQTNVPEDADAIRRLLIRAVLTDAEQEDEGVFDEVLQAADFTL